MSDGPEISIRVGTCEGHVVLVLGTDDEDVLVPMPANVADELSDKIRDAAKRARAEKPQNVT